jgi:hypothetical protein
MSVLCKRDDGSTPELNGLTEEQRWKIADNASEVLKTWHLLPGVTDDRSIDSDELEKWVLAVRESSRKIKVLNGCDIKLAEVLARMPQDPDGIWPHKAVRKLLEKLRNTRIERHIPIAIYNQRGLIARQVGQGGDQERELFDKYTAWAEIVASEWSRSSKILRSLARMYDRAAKRQDISAELEDLRWA